MDKQFLDKIIEDLEKVDDEINTGTKWSQSVKLNKTLKTLIEYRQENFNESTDVV